MNEENKIILQDGEEEEMRIFANRQIPYGLISAEFEGKSSDFLSELQQILRYYRIYKRGATFNVEGTNGDYLPAKLRYKMAASLINKEARFLFAEPPDIKVEAKGDVGKVSEESKNSLTTINDLLKTVLDRNKFEDLLLKAAKDCFIGKRVAGVVNFNEVDGITITFLPSTQFIFETKLGNNNVLTKFVCFIIVRDSTSSADKRVFKKKYVLEDDGFVWIEETLYDGAGRLIEEITEYQPTLLDVIPASVFLNDGLSGEEKGESDIELLADFERWFSRLASADIDAQRKSMNPTKFVVDMETNSTANLSTSAGAFWELGSDQNLDKPSPQVGILEPNMNYSDALKTSLDRIKTTGYEQIDVPNITLESLQGAITSGKSLKAIYWPLIVRCKEKMKMWAPQLRLLVDIIIKGAMAYPDCIKDYINDVLKPVEYDVIIEQNMPLPEDEAEEKNVDLSEVEAKVMSRKSYMQKWRNLTDDEIDEELKQIALERQIIEDSFVAEGSVFDGSTESDEDEEFTIEEETETF